MALRRHRSRVLAEMVRSEGWRRGAELGVYRGETFCHLLQSCSGLTLWGIDRFDTGFYHATREGRPPKRFDLEAEYERLLRWANENAPGRGHLIIGDTVASAGLFGNATLDFVFVDADHRYEAVKADIEAWRPKVRKGGRIVGHDWNPVEFPGVIAAVRELLGEPMKYPDHVWAVTL